MGARGSGMVLRLINSIPLLGQPVQLPDRMCRFCLHVFSFSSCPNHIAHHDGNPNAPALGLVTVIHHEGWALVNAADLPNGFADGVQVSCVILCYSDSILCYSDDIYILIDPNYFTYFNSGVEHRWPHFPRYPSPPPQPGRSSCSGRPGIAPL
jgi:hypothetical protein